MTSQTPMTTPDILALVTNPDALDALDADGLREHFVLLNASYAGSQDATLIPILFDLYQRWAGQSEPDERLGVLMTMARFTEEQRGAPYLGLMPFLTAETDHRVLSTAALNLASVKPPGSDAEAVDAELGTSGEGECEATEYAGVFWLANLLLARDPLGETEGSILAGLLLLGDRRVLEPARAIWQRLPSEGRLRAARARSGVAYRPHLEFLLWALEDETDASVFGALAAAVLNLTHLGDAIVEIERHLPVWDAPDPEQPIQLLSRQSLRETGEALRSQLETLIADEPGDEKVLPKAFAPLLRFDDEDVTDLSDHHTASVSASTPGERARRFAEGQHQADWKGEQFTDTAAFWHGENTLCQLALMMQMQDLRTKQRTDSSDMDPESEDPGQTFPKAFPFYRESVELGLPGDHRQYWLGLATLAGYHFARSNGFDENDPAIREELAGAASYTTGLINYVKDRKPSVGMLGLFHQVLHQTLGLDITQSDDPELLFGLADRALWLGAGVAMARDEKSSAWMTAASQGMARAESTLITSLLDADAAETTGQLMISTLLKLCLQKYESGTTEAEVFGSYFEQALADGGLCQDDPPERWYADAFVFAGALVDEHPEIGRAVLQSVDEETIAYSQEICQECCGGPEVEVTEDVALQAAQTFVEKRQGYHRVPSIRLWNLDRILHGVDLIVWAVLLEASPDL